MKARTRCKRCGVSNKFQAFYSHKQSPILVSGVCRNCGSKHEDVVTRRDARMDADCVHRCLSFCRYHDIHHRPH